MKLTDIDLEQFSREAPTPEPVPSGDQTIEYITKRTKFLTADGQTATRLEQEAILDGNDLLDVNFLDRCMLVRSCIGRIRVAGERTRGWATGFLIAPGLLMTNNHVFPSAGSIGASTISFDYWFDVGGQRPPFTDDYEFRPDLFFVTSDALDYTVVALAPTSASGAAIAERRFIRLIPESGKVKEDEFVTIFQHPEGLPMQVALRENKVKRAAEHEPFIWYQADTAHGSSGSAVMNNSLQVVALHANGRIKRNPQGLYMLVGGGTAASLEGLTETDVIWEANVGFRVSRIVDDLIAQVTAKWPKRLPDIETALRAGDVMSNAIAPGRLVTVADASANPSEQEVKRDGATMSGKTSSTASLTSNGVIIPLQLHISLSAGAPGEKSDFALERSVSSLETEAYKLRMPIIYDGLDTRPGFDRRFLDKDHDVPSPRLTEAGEGVVAPLLDGNGNELKYRHFSVWMHKERRLALYTAANVDWRKRKEYVDGKDTDRDALAGWPGEKHSELWAIDPRLDERHQLPDVFYTNDRTAFDKGHLTRRDDVCWGKTYEEIQMANGDTFHVPNCSPQRKAFNQGQHGQENWGDLETAIETITRKEGQPACIFSGPVLRSDDRWFDGEDTSGSARVRIPSEYWKIILVKGTGGFEVYSFLLQQEVRDVTEEEFYVTDEWIASFKPVSTLQGLMRGWLDLGELAKFDRHPNAGA